MSIEAALERIARHVRGLHASGPHPGVADAGRAVRASCDGAELYRRFDSY